MPYADAGTPTTMILDQGWRRTRREFYYHTAQGTVIKPAAFLEADIGENERADFDGFGRKNAINPAVCGYKAWPLKRHPLRSGSTGKRQRGARVHQ